MVVREATLADRRGHDRDLEGFREPDELRSGLGRQNPTARIDYGAFSLRQQVPCSLDLRFRTGKPPTSRLPIEVSRRVELAGIREEIHRDAQDNRPGGICKGEV